MGFFQRSAAEYPKYNAIELEKMVVGLFLPKKDGITLTLPMIKGKLGITTTIDLNTLGKVVAGLKSENKNVLHERESLPGVYMLKASHLWKDENLKREYGSQCVVDSKTPVGYRQLTSSVKRNLYRSDHSQTWRNQIFRED